MAELECYGIITDDWAAELRKAINAVPAAEPLELRISSPGGMLSAGVTAYNLLRNSQREVHAYLDGDAFSAATLLVCAADYTEMPSNCLMMIHEPFVPLISPATIQETESTLRYLKATRSQVVDIYSDKTKMGKQKIRNMLRAETYFDAGAALDAGLVNNVTSMSHNIQNLALEQYQVRDETKLAEMLGRRTIPQRDLQDRLQKLGVNVL